MISLIGFIGYCKCEVSDKGHSAGTLLDGIDLIICQKCGKMVEYGK